MNKICIYLRKSRADEEIEKELGAGETLLKHRKALLKFAKEKNLNIVEIKEEIVSGESLFFRPKMLELLKEVEERTYTGVLVMDMQRLGRGDMKEQGIILETFKNSNTKIITPQKTYDLNNDFDEEYTEFEAFMSRKELKMINRRMQGGRVRSVEEGNYIGTSAPFGYDITHVKRCRTLKVNEREAEAIRTIFSMYIDGNGANSIADFLNSCGYKTKIGREFTGSSVLYLLKNPIYAGKITWKKREYKKSKTPGKAKDCRTRDKSEWIVSNGKHEAIISEEVFQQAQEILKGKYHAPYKLTNQLTNPVAGIATCAICGKKLVVRPSRNKTIRIMCINKCGNISNNFDEFENAMIKALENYIEERELKVENGFSNIKDTSICKKQMEALQKELKALEGQKSKLFDLLERGIYTEDIFLERSKNIDDRICKTKKMLEDIERNLELISNSKTKEEIHIFKNALEVYKNPNTTQKQKNEFLKQIVSRIEYFKEHKGNDFSIKIFPKLLR